MMKTEKQQAEDVRIAGWTAGATEQDKNTNPHRGKNKDHEAIWDAAWEQGHAGEDFTAWG